MQLTTLNLGKRYNREWIFRKFSYTFNTNNQYAITGPNGSGKSTLLQVLAGAIDKSEGTIGPIKENAGESQYRLISFAAPYLELVEEMTASELLEFHLQFKELILPIPDILEKVNLKDAAGKQIRYYSSGMKQRLKLAQAFFSHTPILFLDEPTTNLDGEGIALYRQLINDQTRNRIVIISSNDKAEYDFCQEVISIQQYK
jgi:ABC-type multidrug transport system ATPase subunit